MRVLFFKVNTFIQSFTHLLSIILLLGIPASHSVALILFCDIYLFLLVFFAPKW